MGICVTHDIVSYSSVILGEYDVNYELNELDMHHSVCRRYLVYIGIMAERSRVKRFVLDNPTI
jgi:hypothetical protein